MILVLLFSEKDLEGLVCQFGGPFDRWKLQVPQTMFMTLMWHLVVDPAIYW